MNEKKLYALTDDVVCYIKQGLQARASGFRANGDVECASHVQKIADTLVPVTVGDLGDASTGITTPGETMSITDGMVVTMRRAWVFQYEPLGGTE